jgi:colicin import membrane protein
MRPQVYRPYENANNSRTFMPFFGISTLCHVVFFGVLLFTPGFKTQSRTTLSVINVSMVTLPDRERIPLPEQHAPAETQKPASISKKHTVTQISSKTARDVLPEPSTPPAATIKPKIKKSLKKETFRPETVLKRAITRIEKEIEAKRPDQVTQAIDRLKDQVEKTVGPDSQKPVAEKQPAVAVGSGAKTKRALELIDIYRIEIAYQIQRNWAFSEPLAGGRTDLTAELAFTVMPSGEIRDIWFDKRSGNDYFDESAKKAVLKSNPLRPHPSGVVKPFIIVGLRFTPKGVK